MNNDEAARLLRGGPNGIKEWNQRREKGEKIPSLQGIDLCEANLRGANLSKADLSMANLLHAQCHEAKFRHATLISTIFDDYSNKGEIMDNIPGLALEGFGGASLLRCSDRKSVV